MEENFIPTYNKLIRNKIPQVTKTNEKTPTKKAGERSGFSDRVFLIEVTNN